MDQQVAAGLEERLRILLPPEYQNTYDSVKPTPMRSAGLKYRPDGSVAWDKIWGSFCDLAMAGGPPHKGMLLEPASRAIVDGAPDRYHQVIDEISRGVSMVTGLTAGESSAGWIQVDCGDETAVAWLVRAITMENVSVRTDGTMLHLPASPAFRLEKEIKNVITVIAKTWHYWDGHMPFSQQWAIGRLFAELETTSPLIEPAHTEDRLRPPGEVVEYFALGQRLARDTELRPSHHQYVGWIGLECRTVRGAIWMMRALVANNVLSRREDTVLFVPVNFVSDPTGERLEQALRLVYELATAQQQLA